jgi:hypothetical protein
MTESDKPVDTHEPEWELTKGSLDRTAGQVRATAIWLNTQRGGRGRYRYRPTTLADGSHRVERTANPDADPAATARRR